MAGEQDRKKEQHRRPNDFGQAVARHALEEARRQKGGRDPSEPVSMQAEITIEPAGSWSVCINLGIVSICYQFER